MKEHVVNKSLISADKVSFTILICFLPYFLLHICFKVSRGELCCSSVCLLPALLRAHAACECSKNQRELGWIGAGGEIWIVILLCRPFLVCSCLSAALSLLPSPSWMKISILYLNPYSCNTFLRPSSNSPGASLFHYPFLQSSRQFSVLFAVLVFMVLVSYDFYFFFFLEVGQYTVLDTQQKPRSVDRHHFPGLLIPVIISQRTFKELL